MCSSDLSLPDMLLPEAAKQVFEVSRQPFGAADWRGEQTGSRGLAELDEARKIERDGARSLDVVVVRFCDQVEKAEIGEQRVGLPADEGRFEAGYHRQPHPKALKGGGGPGMRKRVECDVGSPIPVPYFRGADGPDDI